MLVLDNAPWHRGQAVTKALADPPLESYRLPSYGPRLNPIGRFGKGRRRRATRNRLFERWAS